MTVDMHEYKFILQLEKLPRFEPGGRVDPSVRSVGFPAWRAPFTSLILWGHSTGYRLMSYRAFFDMCKKTYTHKAHGTKFKRWFEGERAALTDQRIRGWYESGLSEMYLYACLVDAFEDILKEGVVFYDPRLDWKQKWDAALTVREHRFYVNALWGPEAVRLEVEAYRDGVERGRKALTSTSAHWDNRERERWTQLVISRSEEDCQIINGVRLFSIPRVNALLREVYEQTGIENRFQFPEAREERKQLYYSLIGR